METHYTIGNMAYFSYGENIDNPFVHREAFKKYVEVKNRKKFLNVDPSSQKF